MRTIALFLLLATAAAPALAAGDNDRSDRRNRGGASEQSESRQTRGEARRSEAREQHSAQRERTPSANQGAVATFREQVRERREQRQQAAASVSNGDSTARETRRELRRSGDNAAPSTLRPRERTVRTIPDTNPNVVTPRRGEAARTFEGRPRRDYRNGDYQRWSNNWRNDRRYDWRRWRDHNRSHFRVGIYYDPFGWNYRRWSIGSFLFPSYYGSRYWLNDPWQYRLPPAYGPYRWVRYWDDALLVNIYTGEVVDVINNFFW